MHGVELLESEAVTGVIVAGGRVAGVETTARSIAAPAVAGAAGAWTRQAAELAGGEVTAAPTYIAARAKPEATPAPARA